MIVCPVCRGRGTVTETVQWSDGLGMAEATCPLCDGAKVLGQSVESIAIRAKADAAKASHELRQLRVHVALFLAATAGQMPNPPLQDARGPSTDPACWRGYLDRAVRDLPRVPRTPLTDLAAGTGMVVVGYTPTHGAMQPAPTCAENSPDCRDFNLDESRDGRGYLYADGVVYCSTSCAMNAHARAKAAHS